MMSGLFYRSCCGNRALTGRVLSSQCFFELRRLSVKPEKHDLHHEFPEHHDRIHALKTGNAHFARLFDEYHDVNREVRRIEEGVENTSDAYLEDLKKKRLMLKDQLLDMIVHT